MSNTLDRPEEEWKELINEVNFFYIFNISKLQKYFIFSFLLIFISQYFY